MGCKPSSASLYGRQGQRPSLSRGGLLSEAREAASPRRESVAGVLARLHAEIAKRERGLPGARLAVCTAERNSIQQEIQLIQENTTPTPSKEDYINTFHQIFLSLGIYKRPSLAQENEDFVANINRKEMRRLELGFLRERESELARECDALTNDIARLKSLYLQIEDLLGSVSATLGGRPSDSRLEAQLRTARATRDTLAASALRLRVAADHAHHAVTAVDEALVAWRLAPNARSSYERTAASGDACRALVAARFAERCARRVLAAAAAPRAARQLRLSLDYAFTDVLHPQKYDIATESFVHFKETVVALINSIHQVLVHHMESLEEGELDAERCRQRLHVYRVNTIAKKGLADLTYKPRKGRKL